MTNDNRTVHQGRNVKRTLTPLEEIKKLNIEKEELYKALLREKDEKITLLQRILDEKS
ncbi:MAG TPA: hypothetical protein VIM75_03770 [Ohtaekwangia sp.]|uniref:hypothetical protein n=1 Tax=Ohtaekwangia sp. TaxID=2066019 RepID=UPI002F95F70C